MEYEVLVIDATETPVEKPKRNQKHFYSGKKKRAYNKNTSCNGKGKYKSDHVHMLISMPPSMSLSKFEQYINGKSSRKLFQDIELLRKRYWDQHL